MNTEVAKIVALLTLGFGSFLMGLLPAALSRYNLRRNLVLQTVLLCFGAGILLATSLVHILPEVINFEIYLSSQFQVLFNYFSYSTKKVREDLKSPNAEIVFCIGFLIVYLSDELLHYCCGEAIQHHHSHPSIEEENRPILSSNYQENHSSYGSNENQISTKDDPNTSCEEHQHRHDTEDETINARICHTSHKEPCRQTLSGIIGMLTALSIHALLEGLAIGVQDTTPKVMILFTAVISHKLIVAFCLGVELTASRGYKLKFHFAAIFVFSAGAVLGIFIGMGLVDLNSVTESKFLPILQGIAGGTLLNVCLCEILPREKARWHQNQTKQTAGLIQFVAFTTGFAVMTLMNVFITEGD